MHISTRLNFSITPNKAEKTVVFKASGYEFEFEQAFNEKEARFIGEQLIKYADTVSDSNKGGFKRFLSNLLLGEGRANQ